MVVRFALPEAGDARLEIFSASGQHVRTLANGAFNAGPHFVIWDGRGDAGQKLPPGTYFARLRMGIRSDSRKVTLIQ
jgi:flagellar hook assembly protein FlgD